MPPPAAPCRRLRLPRAAKGLRPEQLRSLKVMHDGLESILNLHTRHLCYEDIYRAGYMLCLWGLHDVLHEQLELAVRMLRHMGNDRARITRNMFYDVNLYSERNCVHRYGLTSVRRMGCLSLP